MICVLQGSNTEHHFFTVRLHLLISLQNISVQKYHLFLKTLAWGSEPCRENLPPNNVISILLQVSPVLARACSLRAQLLKSALGRNPWELTREIIYPQPQGDTGFASALRKTLSLFQGKTTEGFPPTGQELEQTQYLKMFPRQIQMLQEMCEQNFSAISTSPVLKHVSAGHSRTSFPQAF